MTAGEVLMVPEGPTVELLPGSGMILGAEAFVYLACVLVVEFVLRSPGKIALVREWVSWRVRMMIVGDILA